MDHELARQLKRAFFPQIGKGDMVFEGVDATYIPTLEELIEACEPQNQFELKRKDGGSVWFTSIFHFKHNKRISAEGSTPTEAVARLWLALNMKAV